MIHIQKFDDLHQIQIIIDQSGCKWVGIFGFEHIPQGMGLDKFGDFFSKCYSNETNCNHKILTQTESNLRIKISAQMEFLTLSHELDFNKYTSDPVVSRELIENIKKSIELKLNKMITLIDLRNFKLINLNTEQAIGEYFTKHRIEFELSKLFKNNKQDMLVGYESLTKSLDLSAYPYEYIDWTQINNFYNLEEMVINGQSGYKFFSAAGSNQLDTSIFISEITSIGTINPNLKKLTINNIYRVEGDLGHLDWAPNLEELNLIGCKGKIKIVECIKRNRKLKKINLINCVPRISDPVDPKKEPTKPIYRESVLGKNPNYEIKGVSPWNNSSIVLDNPSSTYSTSIVCLVLEDWANVLKHWCLQNNIELNISDYIDDKKTNKYDFPYLEYRADAVDKEKAAQMDNYHFEMTDMDVSGFKNYSMDQIESNDKKNSFASCL